MDLDVAGGENGDDPNYVGENRFQGAVAKLNSTLADKNFPSEFQMGFHQR